MIYKKKKKSNILLALALCICCSLTGCVNLASLNYTNEPFLTDIEYKKIVDAEHKTKQAIQRDIILPVVELYNAEDEFKETLYKRAYEELNNLVLKTGYQGLDTEHDYFNLLLDAWKQSSNPKYYFAKNMSNYYVKVELEMENNKEVSEFKKPANYVGIQGAINYDENGNEVVDINYLKTLVDTINTYRNSIGLDGLDTDIEQINYMTDIDEDYIFSDLYISQVAEATGSNVLEDNSQQYALDQENENIFDNIEGNDEAPETDVFNRVIRKLVYNAEDFNNIVGMSKSYYSVIPSPLALFKIKQSNKIQGFCLYDWGSTIKEVQNITPKVELRFIFQRTPEGDDFNFITFYVDNITTTQVEGDNSIKYVDKFVKQQLEITIEDFNRAYANKDIARLTSGDLIYPQDLGLYFLLLRNTTDTINNDIWIHRLLRQEGNTYLLEVNQLTTELPRGVNATPGKIYRKWLMRIGLHNNMFKILDAYPLELHTIRIPEVDVISGAQEKIYSLQRQNIKGTVTGDLKKDIYTELQKLSTALTYKFATDTLDKKGNIMKSEKHNVNHWGIADRFCKDITILSADKYDEYIKILSNKLTKYPSIKDCNVIIIPDNWLAGNDNQCELTASLLFNYKGKYADIIRAYMVYNKFSNKWTIDEFTIIDEESFDAKNTVESYIKNFEDAQKQFITRLDEETKALEKSKNSKTERPDIVIEKDIDSKQDYKGIKVGKD